VGVLHRLYRVFRRKSPHHQGQLAVGCGLDGKSVDAQYILGSVGTAAVHFHDKLYVFHGSFQGRSEFFSLNVFNRFFGLSYRRQLPPKRWHRAGSVLQLKLFLTIEEQTISNGNNSRGHEK